MSDNWVVQNLQNALETWNSKLAEIWSLVTTTPETFKGGAIWNVIKNIHNSMQGIGLGLLVLFFLVGMVKTCGSFDEVKRPEQVFKLFIRFVLAKIIVTYGMTLMLDVFKVTQGPGSQSVNILTFSLSLSSQLLPCPKVLTRVCIPPTEKVALISCPFSVGAISSFCVHAVKPIAIRPITA